MANITLQIDKESGEVKIYKDGITEGTELPGKEDGASPPTEKPPGYKHKGKAKWESTNPFCIWVGGRRYCW